MAGGKCVLLNWLGRLFSSPCLIAGCQLSCVPPAPRLRVCSPQEKKPPDDVVKEIDRLKALLDPLEAKKQIELTMPKIREDPVRGGEKEEATRGVDNLFV